MTDYIGVKEQNRKNKTIELGALQFILFLSNTWMTFFAPLAISLFVARLYTGVTLSTPEIWIFTICVILHVSFAFIAFRASSKRSLSIEIDKIIAENEDYKNEITPMLYNLYDTSQLQQQVLLYMTLELENLIDEFNDLYRERESNSSEKNEKECDVKIGDLVDKGLDRILRILAKFRAELFDYSGTSFYNICLYIYDEKANLLKVEWRKHDDRLETSDRDWKPGKGHVGLTFIQNELKICHDIFASTELSASASTSGDKEKYRSFLSVPIRDASKLSGDNGENPLGVLVLTSNAEAQFSFERDQMFVLTIAKILAIYIDKCTK